MSISYQIDIKKKLQIGKSVVGTWCEVPSPEFINILAKAGLDFVIVDMEHGQMDFNLAAKMVVSAQSEGCAGLIRVSRNDESDILRALDTGCDGIVIPHIETAEDKNKAISNAKFSPIGTRSLNPFTRAGDYQSPKNFTSEQNAKILLILLVEGIEGIKNIEKIASDENVDAIYIGTYDLSVALGVPGETKNPRVIKVLKDLVVKIKKHKKAVGCMFHTREELTFMKKLGLQFFCYKVDTSVVYDEFKKIVGDFNNG